MSISKTFHHTKEQLASELDVILAAQKNTKYFEVLYNKYYEQIFRYCHQRVDSEDTAHDLTSQVFLKALTNLKKYEYKGVPFGSWLFRIAMSVVYQSFKDQKAKKTINIDSISFKSLIVDDSSESIFSSEEQNRLKKALKTLKKEEIEIIELRYFESRSFKEIAEILSIKENNAKVKAHRILGKLKTNFAL
jgi:RNA polymerase sigma-70 factor (ECF subfamily)